MENTNKVDWVEDAKRVVNDSIPLKEVHLDTYKSEKVEEETQHPVLRLALTDTYKAMQDAVNANENPNGNADGFVNGNEAPAAGVSEKPAEPKKKKGTFFKIAALIELIIIIGLVGTGIYFYLNVYNGVNNIVEDSVGGSVFDYAQQILDNM